MTARISPARLREISHYLAFDEQGAPLSDGAPVTLDATERGMLMRALTMAAEQLFTPEQEQAILVLALAKDEQIRSAIVPPRLVEVATREREVLGGIIAKIERVRS